MILKPESQWIELIHEAYRPDGYCLVYCTTLPTAFSEAGLWMVARSAKAGRQHWMEPTFCSSMADAIAEASEFHEMWLEAMDGIDPSARRPYGVLSLPDNVQTLEELYVYVRTLLNIQEIPPDSKAEPQFDYEKNSPPAIEAPLNSDRSGDAPNPA